MEALPVGQVQDAEELLELGRALLCVARDWRITRMNRPAEKLVGRTRGEALGRALWDVWPALARPDAPTRQELDGAMQARVPIRFELFQAGAEAWTAVEAVPTGEGGLAIFCRDVTELRTAQEALRRGAREASRRAAEAEAVFEAVVDALVVYDADGRVVHSNAAFDALFGLTPEERRMPAPERIARGRVEWRDEQGRALPVAELPALRTARRGAIIEGEVLRVKTDSGERWLRLSSSPIHIRGVGAGAVVSMTDITERRRADDALAASEAQFRSVFEQAAIGMGRARFEDARWIDVNEALCRMLGRRREEMLRIPWTEMTHPEDLALDLDSFRRMAAGELDTYTVEKRLLHADGHPVWARLTLSLVRDAAGLPAYEVAIVEDVSERKRGEAELAGSRARLEAERARLQAVVDTIPVGLFLVDVDGALALMNDEARRIWAGSAPLRGVSDYAEYRAYWPGTGARLRAEEWPVAQAVQHGRTLEGLMLDIDRFDGRRGTILASGAPIRDEAGRVVGGLAVNLDISELRATQARLEEADRRKNEFLGMLSHELRNPLAPIRNALYLLERADAGSDQGRRAQEVLHRQVAHLSRLVDDLLDVTRIARGKIELRRADLDLVDLTRRTVEDHRALLDARGLTLALELEAGPLPVHGDATRLAQVLGNLLSNAAKFTPAGGRVTVALARRGERAELHVRDTGPGIAPEVLPTLFEPFSQAQQTLARSEGGLGLGLAMVKGLVALHGGTVGAASAAGGADFAVSLPLAGGRAGAEVAAEEPAARPAGRHRVLVVDDNRDAAETLAELVELLGHEVEVAYDGPSALERAAASHPDLILCDIGLPGMDGYEVARALRAAHDGAIHLVALSGYAQPEDVARALEAGFDRHVAKPPDPGHLERLLA